ncbi:MAG: biopolymer transporter ExbD [Rhodoferax sp.]|jgi:biopolymer transport protein TolR|nr:biopolymer transporter ExbD [Rhodoferax sp.]
MAFGRLERTRGDPPMSDINMTPLIDVMLVLVVIFLITAPLLASAIRLDLPRSDAAGASDAAKSVLVVVDKAGQVYLEDKPVSLAALAERMTRLASQDPDTEVQLRADDAVAYGRVVEVIGVAQKAGLGRIGFVADRRPARP